MINGGSKEAITGIIAKLKANLKFLKKDLGRDSGANIKARATIDKLCWIDYRFVGCIFINNYTSGSYYDIHNNLDKSSSQISVRIVV